MMVISGKALSSFLLLLHHQLIPVHCDVLNGDITFVEYAQVYVGHEFLPICWEKSTRNAVANTLCKQLGLNGAKSTNSIRWESGIPISSRAVHIESCKNDASHIFQCVYNISSFEKCCKSNKTIAVTCSSAQYVYEGQLSLVEKPNMTSMTEKTESSSKGMLRVYLNGKWTSVCYETFGAEEAECSCKQLGYTGHISFSSHHNSSGDRNNMVWIGTNSYKGRLNCSSSERCLTKCYLKPEKTTECTNSGEVYLKCDYNMTASKHQTGSKSACEFNKKSNENMSRAEIAGIVFGSLLFGITFMIGICFCFYFSVKAKKPCIRSKSCEIQEASMKLSYSAVENSNYDSACTDSEQDDKFDCHHYQPVVST